MYAPDVTAANHIFTERYNVLIPRSFMYGPEYIRKAGYGTTGDATVDRMQASSLERMNQTIAGLSVLYCQGAEPLLANPPDCIPIYKAIVKHLNDWKDFSHQGLNPEYCPPMEDFRALEALAVYFHFTVQELEPIPQSNSKLVDSILSMNRGARMTQRTQQAEEPSIPAFVSIADTIEENIYGG
jgi:hypothetical protein